MIGIYRWLSVQFFHLQAGGRGLGRLSAPNWQPNGASSRSPGFPPAVLTMLSAYPTHRAELPLQLRTQHCAPPTHPGLSRVLVPGSSCPWPAAGLLSIHEEEAPDAGRARAEPRGL